MKSLFVVRIVIIVFFIAFYGAIYITSTKNKNDRISDGLEQQIDYLENNYKVSTDRFKTISYNFYHTLLLREDFLQLYAQAMHTQDLTKRAQIRKRMYEILQPHFKRMQKTGVNIMLFSSPDNKTFLRVHKLNKYGDDLSSVRYSITYVNKYEKPISGFEQGKISHAFRNVYPLRYNGEYLGSVDIAFSSDALQKNMIRLHGIDTHFIVNKNIFETKIWKFQKEVKYTQSIEHEDFLFSVTPAQKDKAFSSQKIRVNAAIKDEVTKKILQDKPFSLYKTIEEKTYVLAFLPIKNIKDKKVVAYLVSYKDSPILHNILNKYIVVNIVSALVLLLLSLVIYSNIKQRLLLEIRVAQEVKKNQQQQQHMFNQSRLAQMGELISMIAHQWRQPLGSIAATVADMELKIKLEKFDLSTQEGRGDFEVYYLSKIYLIGDLTQNLSTTIDDFRNFYKTNKKFTKVLLNEPIHKALAIIKSSMITDNITIHEEYNAQTLVSLYENEFMQVVLNILKNAQDNFSEVEMLHKHINIKTYETHNEVVLEISDNGGGISEDIIFNIFDPYFSTKNEKNGTGLGLYMSKIIIQEHHHGSIEAKNIDDGVSFIIHLDKQSLID